VDATPASAGKPLVIPSGQTASAADLNNPNRPLGALLAIKKQMAALGVNTNGASVGEHPAFKGSPAARAAMAKAVSDFVAKFCSFDKLMVITYMGLEGSGNQPWLWFGGDANQGNAVNAANGGKQDAFSHWGVAPQPTMGDKIRFNNTGTADATGTNGHVVTHPIRNAKDGSGAPVDSATIAMLFDTVPAPGATTATLSTDVQDQTNRLENPRLHRPDNTDCFSCHATNTQMRAKGIRAGLKGENNGNVLATQDNVGVDPNAVGPSNTTFVVKDGISAYVENATQPGNAWNVRNFGRDGGKISVSYLMVQSAGDVAAFTNGLIGIANGPGITCGAPAKQVALRNCTLFGLSAASTVAGAPAVGAPATIAQCMQFDPAVQGCRVQ
jgi:hypothetical protein